MQQLRSSRFSLIVALATSLASGCLASGSAANDDVIADIALADGGRVAFRVSGDSVVISEDALIGESFPLDDLNLTGRTSLEVFQALRPGEPVPDELAQRHPAEAEALRRAPRVETPKQETAATYNQCRNYVFQGFAPYVDYSKSFGCYDWYNNWIAAATSLDPNNPDFNVGSYDAARTGTCNNTSATGYAGYKKWVRSGSRWIKQSDVEQPLAPGAMRRFTFSAEAGQRYIEGNGGSPVLQVGCSTIFASAGSFAIN